MTHPLTYASKIAYSSYDTLKFSFDMAVKYKNFPGCYVETGVAAGAQIIAMSAGAPNKRIYAFDSFCGIPLCSNRDDQMPGIAMLTKAEQKALPSPGKQALKSSGATAVSVEDFMDHLKNSGIDYRNIVTVPGWFEETIPTYDTGPIAILRLDGDLFHSTWVCLQYLFPAVLKHGLVIVDDFNLQGCRDACTEYFQLIGYEPELKFISDIAYFEKS